MSDNTVMMQKAKSHCDAIINLAWREFERYGEVTNNAELVINAAEFYQKLSKEQCFGLEKLTQENARLTELAAQKASRCDELYEVLLSCRSALHEANMYVGFDFNTQLDNIGRLVSKINNEGSDNG